MHFTKTIVIGLISLSATFSQASALFPLKVDGCTGTSEGDWGHCCVEHDISYWVGGSSTERKEADQRLFECIQDSSSSGQETVFYNTVRVFGPHFWSAAWPKRELNTLSALELEDIQNEIDLAKSIGSPIEFEYIVQESILFQSLTTSQKKQIFENLTVFARSEFYQSFVRTYKKATGRNPFTLNYHK